MREISHIIPLLVILHQAQSGSYIEDWLGQYAGQQKSNLINRQSRSLGVETESQTNQEVMSQRHQQHMVMPAQPAAHFIVVKADFSFGFFEDRFDWPTHSTDAYEFNQRGAGRALLK